MACFHVVVVALVVFLGLGNVGEFAMASVGGDVHVVGGNQGWDAASDVAAWAMGRSFRVGDNIWFTYSAAEESIAELGSQQEYESCDVANPIRMYTAGLDKIELDRQGPRYFVSSAPESCSKGLKLHVHVEPDQPAETEPKQSLTQVHAASGPVPSSSVEAGPASVSGLALLCLIGIFQIV